MTYNRENSLKKVNALIAGMTLEQKLSQLNLLGGGDAFTGALVTTDLERKILAGQVGGVFNMMKQDSMRRTQTEAVKTSLPLLFAGDVIHGLRMPIFPLPIGMANSWEPEMVEKTARIAGLQTAAEGMAHVYSPMIDVSRQPQWGRTAEGFGEDPHLVSKFAVAMVRGYQGYGPDMTTEHVAACIKHFVAYGAGRTGLDYAEADMSPQELHDVYLPPFIAATEAGACSIMTAFNEVNGIPMHANGELINILRDINPDLMVTSDYTGINEMIGHGLGDGKEVAARALEAGVDQDMVGSLFLDTLKQSLNEGRVTIDQVDAACRRVLMLKDKMGLLDDPFRYFDKGRLDTVAAREPEFRAFARETVARSVVLLRNEDKTLPLQKSGKIAVIGPLADSRENMPGTWAVAGDMSKCSTVLEGIMEVAGDKTEVFYAKGANITNHTEKARRYNVFSQTVFIDERTPEEMRAEAIEAANKADTVILVVGEAKEASGESSSMTNIGLPRNQIELVRAVVATGKPVTLVVMSGRPMTLEDILMDENDLALGQGKDAIKEGLTDLYPEKLMPTMLWMPFGGTETGGGLADVIFGDYNPSGKLAMTFPRHVLQGSNYATKSSGRNTEATSEYEKFKLRWLDRKSSPLFPFGHGLSYTSFDYSEVTFNKDRLSGEEKLQAYATITNTGACAGEEVVQLYITDPVASRTQPVRRLKNFQKIMLQPGESRTVAFEVTTKDLEFSTARHVADTSRTWEAGEFILQISRSSSHLNRASVFWDKPKVQAQLSQNCANSSQHLPKVV